MFHVAKRLNLKICHAFDNLETKVTNQILSLFNSLRKSGVQNTSWSLKISSVKVCNRRHIQ